MHCISLLPCVSLYINTILTSHDQNLQIQYTNELNIILYIQVLYLHESFWIRIDLHCI